MYKKTLDDYMINRYTGPVYEFNVPRGNSYSNTIKKDYSSSNNYDINQYLEYKNNDRNRYVKNQYYPIDQGSTRNQYLDQDSQKYSNYDQKELSYAYKIKKPDSNYTNQSDLQKYGISRSIDDLNDDKYYKSPSTDTGLLKKRNESNGEQFGAYVQENIETMYGLKKERKNYNTDELHNENQNIDSKLISSMLPDSFIDKLLKDELMFYQKFVPNTPRNFYSP